MEYALSTSDTLEHLLSELASAQAMRVSGDSRLAAALTTTKAPGQDHVAPLWAVTAANDIAKAQYSQYVRVIAEKAGVQGRRGSPNVVVVIDEHGNTTGGDTAAKEPVRRRPRRPKAGKVEGKGNTGSPPNNGHQAAPPDAQAMRAARDSHATCPGSDLGSACWSTALAEQQTALGLEGHLRDVVTDELQRALSTRQLCLPMPLLPRPSFPRSHSHRCRKRALYGLARWHRVNMLIQAMNQMWRDTHGLDESPQSCVPSPGAKTQSGDG